MQGLLKTAALATLVLPLLVLAVPVLDTSFVVAKRLRSGQPIYVADARHLHHRFMRIGFSRAARGRLPLDVVRDARARGARDAVRAAAPPRPLERHEPRDRRRRGLLAVAFSLYVVYLLEIVKLASPRARRRDAARNAA